MHTVFKVASGRQRIQQHCCAGSRKLLVADDFLAVTSGAAAWVNVTAVTLSDLEFAFDADDGSGVAKGYVFLNGTAEPRAAGDSGGQRVAGGGAPSAASMVKLMHASSFQVLASMIDMDFKRGRAAHGHASFAGAAEPAEPAVLRPAVACKCHPRGCIPVAMGNRMVTSLLLCRLGGGCCRGPHTATS